MRPTLVAAIVVVVVIAAGIAAYSVGSTGSTASSSGTSTSNDHSSSLGSSVSISSSAIEPTVQYPLVWGPNPLSVCDAGAFCISAMIGFSSQQGTNNDTLTSATSTVEHNETFIVRGFTTTVIRSGQTYTNYVVEADALVQDAVTGLNATGPNGPVIGGGCYIPPTGFTDCLISAPYDPSVPSGHAYKVTVFVRGVSALPCLSQPCPSNTIANSSQLLAPPSPTITVPPAQ